MTPLLSTPLAWWSLTWPRTVEVEELHAGLRRLAGARRIPIILRAEGQPGAVRHLIGSLHDQAPALLGQAIHGLRIAPTAPAAIGGPSAVLSLRFSTRRRAMVTEDTERVSAGVMAALAAVRAGERLVLEWVLLDVLAPEAVPSRLDGAGPEDWVTAALVAPWRAPGRVDGELRRAMAAKRSDAGWRANGRLAVVAATKARRRTLLAGVLGALRAAESPGLRLLARQSCSGNVGHAGALTGRPVALSVNEVPLMVAWPLGDLYDSLAMHAPSRTLEAHRDMPALSEDRRQRLVAVGCRGGGKRALVLSPADGLRHLHVLGPTGVGKSTMLLGLIEADMQAGRSLVIFDPKGDLLTDVLARVPRSRRDHVVVLDPSDERPVGLNPLAGPGDPEMTADGLLGTLHELFSAHWGPRTQDILHASLLTLARTPGSSVALVPLLLTNPGYRATITAKLKDPLGLSGFWDWYEALSEAERLAAIGPVMNKLRQLLLRPALRSVLGQAEPRFNLNEVFADRRIVLVNLATGNLGPEGSALFGALVWSHLWQLVQGRSRIEAKRRHPVTVYADEFQEYLKTPVSFTDMLVRARGFGVGLVLAHQHLGQLSTEVREAVLANAGSRVVFGLQASDATAIAKLGRGLVPEDIDGLGAYEVYASLLRSGEPTGWMSGRTQPASAPLVDSTSVQAISQRRYGISRADTEAALLAVIRMQPSGRAEDSVGVKRRTGGRS